MSLQSRHSSPPIAIAIATALLLLASPAEAHLVTTGLGPFYDGAGHLLISPEDWATVLALAMFAGLAGRPAARKCLLFAPLAWMAGGILASFAPLETPRLLTAVLLLVVGAFVAADQPAIHRGALGIATAIALAHGYLNGSALTKSGAAILSVAGAALAVVVIMTLIAALVVGIRASWQRIVVRVAGSWVAAIGILLAGWALRRG